jgi:hypothetical protein
MELLKNKKIIIALVAIVILVGIALLTSKDNSNSGETPETKINTGQRTDEDSGEVISDPPGKDKDVVGTNTDAPLILGTSNFVDQGVSLEQEDTLKYTLYDYFGGKSKKIDQISIIVDSIAPVPYDPNANTTTGTINFRVRVNEKDTYKVTLNYYDDMESIQTIIYDTLDKQLYDSGQISGKTLNDKR